MPIRTLTPEERQIRRKARLEANATEADKKKVLTVVGITSALVALGWYLS